MIYLAATLLIANSCILTFLVWQLWEDRQRARKRPQRSCIGYLRK